MRYFFLTFASVLLAVVLVAGPQGRKSENRPFEIFPDMDHQPKVKAQAPSGFFADRVGPRAPVAGTVPIGLDMPEAKKPAHTPTAAEIRANATFTATTSYLDTGKMGDRWGDGMPTEVKVDREFLLRGKDRYEISCAVCHGSLGDGKGVTSKYGWNGIANYHDQRLVEMSDGEIYNTITNGKNTMLGYGANISVMDRWAIVAWVRVLQTARLGKVADLTPAEREKLPK
ncbi:MAG: cytochrome c [Verrucomicrobia bacterium]|nr:cytochrome c [Verrucomicrobiota bacterium]